MAIIVSVYALSSLLATFANVVFAVFVLLKNAASKVNRLWSLTIFSIAVWGASEFIERLTADLFTAQVANRIGGVGFCLMPATFLHFTLEFSEQGKWLSKKWLPAAIYAPSVVFSLLQLSGYITKVTPEWWGYATSPSIGYWPFILWLEGLFVLGLYFCFHRYRTATSKRPRSQTLFVILGTVVPLSIGSFTDAFMPLFGIETLRTAVVATTITVAFVSYGIVRFQLMSLTPQTTASIVLNTISDLLAVVDPAGKVLFTNTSFQTTLLFNEEKGTLLTVADFVIGKKLVYDVLDRMVAGSKQSSLIEVSYTTSSGESFPVILSISAIYDHDEFLGCVLLGRDISERMLAEEQIREQAELLDNANDAIIVADLSFYITYWNKGAERLYGWTNGEALCLNVADLLETKDDHAFAQAINTLQEQGERSGEEQHRTKEGKHLFVETRWTLIRDSRNVPKAILMINTDRTEKRQLEQQFLRAQRLGSLGTIASGIAHDLNNVLSPVLMGVHGIRKKLNDERSLQILDSMEQSTKRGATMVRQILAFVRGLESERGIVHFRYLAAELEKILRETFPKNILLEKEIAPDLFPVTGDSTQLHQVLLNLCVNARDAMPEGGVLRLKAENTDITKDDVPLHADAKEGKYVLVTVSDTGVGIPREILEKIFDPFFTTKEAGKGTGLGLSTVLTIVKHHGGFVLVKSEVRKGTTFSMYFPAAEESLAEQAEEEKPELPAGHGEHVLLVEDEAAILQIAKETLETYGYNIIAAKDGAEAIALYAEQGKNIHIVLTDSNLPYVDGRTMIRILKRMNPAVRIVASSGLSPGVDPKEMLNLGADAYIQKPYTVEKLLRTLHDVLNRNGGES
ncbi:MAG: PAS domain S-box protein [Bacteroidota bacterium]|nr:PAS domain S-box protein [Bacteroidota bacterium]